MRLTMQLVLLAILAFLMEASLAAYVHSLPTLDDDGQIPEQKQQQQQQQPHSKKHHATTFDEVYSQLENSPEDYDYRPRLKPRRYDIRDWGNDRFFRGWADVQGQGAANDYCRVIGTHPKTYFLSCALAGSHDINSHVYVSMRGFNIGHRHTWFMRDMDGDGRDDYCRCVGHELRSHITCMKAGPLGFHGSIMQDGEQHSFRVRTAGPCFHKTFHPLFGPR